MRTVLPQSRLCSVSYASALSNHVFPHFCTICGPSCRILFCQLAGKGDIKGGGRIWYGYLQCADVCDIARAGAGEKKGAPDVIDRIAH